MATQEPTLFDYIAVLRRRRVPALCVAALIILGFVYVAYTLPALYQSEAVIIIEQQGLASDIVDSKPVYPEERIQEVRQRVMTAESITGIIHELGLYPDRVQTEPIDDLIAQFRTDTTVAPESAAVVSRTTGRMSQATFAFGLTFQYGDPKATQKVTQRLANLFVSENEGLGVDQTAGATEFLRSETQRLEDKLRDVEQRLADFKARNAQALPENVAFNRETLGRLETQLADVNRNLRAAREQEALLANDLAQTPRDASVIGTDGQPVLSTQERLAALQQQLASLLGRYSPDHPDVVSLKRQIAALTSGVQGDDRAAALRTELATTEAELAAAREHYSDTHPDVQRLQRSVDALKTQIAALPPASASTAPPTNPAYVQAKTRLDAANDEVQALTSNRDDLTQRIKTYEDLLARAPEVERQYNDLMREHTVTTTEYRQLRANQQQAELAQNLESGGHSGWRFSIIEPPRIPTTPVSPNLLALIFLGVVVALASALVAVALLEGLDGTVRGQRDVRSVLEIPPLAVIPFIETRWDQRRRKLKTLALTLVLAVAAYGVAMTIVSHTQVS